MTLTYGRGLAAAIIAATLWSGMGLGIRLIGEASAWQVIFYRALGTVPILVAALWFLSGGRPLSRVRAAGKAGIMGGAGLVVAFCGAVFALQSTTVANAVFLYSAAPLVTLVLARPILGEPVRPGTWVAVAVALVGVFIMVREGLAIGAVGGNIAALVSALGFSVYTLSLRWGRQSDMLPATLIGSVLTLAVGGIMIMSRGETFALAPGQIAMAMSVGAVILGFGLWLYTIGSRVVPAAQLAPLILIEVMFSPFWVWLFLGETATAGTLLGGAILCLALLVNMALGVRFLRAA